MWVKSFVLRGVRPDPRRGRGYGSVTSQNTPSSVPFSTESVDVRRDPGIIVIKDFWRTIRSFEYFY